MITPPPQYSTKEKRSVPDFDVELALHLFDKILELLALIETKEYDFCHTLNSKSRKIEYKCTGFGGDHREEATYEQQALI